MWFNMGFFDFLAGHPAYAATAAPSRRLNKRHRMVVEPYLKELRDARMLDLGAHDGRWSYAFAAAGAASVVGIEARGQLIEQFAAFPDDDAKARVHLVEGDIFAALEHFAAENWRFDVIAVLGLYYHIMDHFRLLQLIRAATPRLVLIDGEFMLARSPMIQLVREKTGKPMNAAPQFLGQKRAVKGVPTFAAMEVMADALDYDLVWGDASLFANDTAGVKDYFRKDRFRRAVCALRPR